jgi:hypothetical protein
LRFEELNRIIKPLFTLYEQRKSGDRHMVSLFYGLYTREEKGDEWTTRFAFLLRLKKDRNGIGFEVLSGLFGMDSNQMRIFFIPFKRN